MVFCGSHFVLWQKNYVWKLCQSPVSQSSYNFSPKCCKTIYILFLLSSTLPQITVKFRTCHNSCAVGACAKFHGDHECNIHIKRYTIYLNLVSIVKSPVSQAEAVVNQIRTTFVTLSCQKEVRCHRRWSCTNLSLQNFLFSIDYLMQQWHNYIAYSMEWHHFCIFIINPLILGSNSQLKNYAKLYVIFFTDHLRITSCFSST